MRQIKAVIFLFVLFIIQTVIFSRLPLFGICLDLFAGFVVIWGLKEGPAGGFLIGLIAGIFADSMYGTGQVFMFSAALLGFVAGTLKGAVFKDQNLVMYVLVFAGNIAYSLISSSMLQNYFDISLYAFWNKTLLSAVLNTAFVPLIASVYNKISGNHE